MVARNRIKVEAKTSGHASDGTDNTQSPVDSSTVRSAALIKAHEDVELVSNELNLAKNLRDYYRGKLFEAEVERLDKPCARRRNKVAKIKSQLEQITREYARIDYNWDLIHKDYRRTLSRVETNDMNWYHG